jgi:predicted enzyme related to lactoylglutathione lyase
MLRGLTTINYYADDVAKAVTWYSEVLGAEPYFSREVEGRAAYVEYRIGDYLHEFGILDRNFAGEGAVAEAVGPIAYWAVDDVDAAYQRLLDLGATPHQPPNAWGEGFITASVVDPFGNILGVMFNEHYLNVVARVIGETASV